MIDYRGKLQAFLNRELKDYDVVNILEAGCGSLTKLTFQQHTIITGIDISEKQLERNKALDKKIQGDLHTYDLGKNKYDLIVCWDVLEHLEKPKLALNNLVRSLKPGGMLLIKLPNLMSLKGLITRFSSHKLHVLYYKLVYKKKDAGKNDTGPFKSYLKYAVSPRGLKKYARSNNLEMPYFEFHDASDDSYFFGRLKFKKLFRTLYNIMNRTLIILSLGMLNTSELALVIRKRVEKHIDVLSY